MKRLPSRLPRFRLLVVDDEPNVLFTLRLVFEHVGYDVVCLESAKQAIRLLRTRTRFDAVVTDLHLEEEDIGLKVAAMATKVRPRPVIIVITGFWSLQNASQALHIGVDHYAMKPLDVDELLSTLNRLLIHESFDRGAASQGVR